MIVSLMVPCTEEILEERSSAAVEWTPRPTPIELNFGCPHGMSERGMGSAVGQVPEYIEMVTRWCKQHSADAGVRQAHPQRHQHPGPGPGGGEAGGADAVSLINTINSGHQC